MGQRQFSESAKSLSSKEILEPRARVELATCRLRIGCSTTELPRPLIIKDLLPRQTHFRITAIKLPSDCHHWPPKSALCSPTLDPLSPVRRGRPSDIATGDPYDSLEERLSPFVEYPYRVGPLSRRAKRTEVSLSLSPCLRKFLGLQVFPFSKPVQIPEGSKGHLTQMRKEFTGGRNRVTLLSLGLLSTVVALWPVMAVLMPRADWGNGLGADHQVQWV